MAQVSIGVDVGGTNTDAVVLYNQEIIAKCKQPTTKDVTAGIQHALSKVLAQLSRYFRDKEASVSRVNIGTTHFLNAVLQRKDLARVAVIRLCGPSSTAVPPFSDFPDGLKAVVFGRYYFIDGGYEFDGKKIKEVREKEVIQVITQLKESDIKHIVVSGIFSTVCADQEIAVGQILKDNFPEASFTLSHQVGHMGLLERENSSILNESLKPLGFKSIAAFTKAIRDVGLKCPIFFTQNDGTILSAEKSSEFPVLTFSSGPTNSMRGAAFLSDKKDAIVVDIGGTSTDVGVLVHGFPREASTRVKCGGVTTNFRMPDVLCVALGGGSIVRTQNDNSKLTVGPDSVGYDLVRKSWVYGGTTLTTTDVAVAAGLCKIGVPSKVASLDETVISKALSVIVEMIESSVDQVKVKAENQPVVLVGGGSILIDAQKLLSGASVVVKPDHFEVANAVGAVLNQVSGTVEHVVNLAETSREDAMQEVEKLAHARAIQNGAQPETVATVEKTEIQLSYLKGNATRMRVKAVGDLFLPQAIENAEKITLPGLPQSDKDLFPDSVVYSAVETFTEEQSQNVQETKDEPDHVEETKDEAQPFIDPSTGDWLINEFDIECIATGAGILGCGGGGSPYIGRVRALSALKSGKKIRVIHPENLPEKGLIMGIGYMGAPSIVIERLVSLRECRTAMEYVQKALVCDESKIELGKSSHGTKFVKHWNTESVPVSEEKKIIALMSFEIGGCNSIEPLILGAEVGLPVVDCDGMGRAFPELQMFTPSIYGESWCPAAVVGCQGDSEVVIHAETPKALENHLREVVVTKMGCEATIAAAPLTTSQLLESSVLFSMSRAWRLGNAVKMAQKEKRCPIQAILDVQNGKLLISGKITDVERKTEGGFNKGKVKLEGVGDFFGSSMIVLFQNENLIVERDIGDGGQRQLIATTPDLIVLVESESGEAVPTEDARYGLRVSLVLLPCSPLLTNEKALKVVGPNAFGYDHFVYQPTDGYEQCVPIPLPKSRAHQG